MKLSEIVLLAGLAVFSGVLFISSLDMPYGSEQSFGPGYIPLNIALVVLGLIGILAVKAFMAGRKPGADGSAVIEDLSSALPVAAVIVLLAGAIYAMSWGSILAPLGLLMIILSWRFNGHGFVKSCLVSAAILAVIYTIFSLWLKIPLQ
ncbi:tripartite tricarboxylate transporter TctB family protein [Nitratireductor sp.]|uniref:tripartite tricarboxylate transporter TctB family protein n=1 Tax=Nitratireductor sp. TaxID=1872084 RepID=UPI0026207384|nr:tripartite tricarboxylate transporter TctB family protein [Nitratireductor sp.]MCV0378663.1 tripartite tricarboxylate transporter TctB family protein [Nitratireductor sp.]